MKSAFLSAALLCTVALAHAAQPGTADGTMTVDGKSTPLKYSISRTKPNPFDKKKTDVVVLISDIPVSGDAFKDDFTMMKFTDDAKMTGVMVEIDPEKDIISGTLYSPLFTKFGGQFSATGMHKLELTTFNGTDVAGKVWIPKDEEFSGVHYTYSTTFHAAPGTLTPPPAPSKTAKALPADGGAPGKAYTEYMKVLMTGTLDDLKKRLTSERAKMLDDPDAKKMLPMIRAMQPTKIKIKSGSVDGKTATLIATGMSDGTVSNGTITMVNEGGVWKVEKESWQSGSD